MTRKEAYDALDVSERQKIAQAVCCDEENPIQGEAAQIFYDALDRLDGSIQYSIMEWMDFQFAKKILEDNPF